jgi:hypothetical protein
MGLFGMEVCTSVGHGAFAAVSTMRSSTMCSSAERRSDPFCRQSSAAHQMPSQPCNLHQQLAGSRQLVVSRCANCTTRAALCGLSRVQAGGARCAVCVLLQGALGLLLLTTRVSMALSQSPGPGATRACWTATTTEQSAEASRSTSRWDRQAAADTAAGSQPHRRCAREPIGTVLQNLCADT